MKKIVLHLCVLVFFVVNTVLAQHNTATGFDFIVNEDGVWTWYNDERAVFKNDRLYTSYVKKNGRVGLSVNNIKTGATIGNEVLLSEWVEKDDHNNASLLLREDGKIMAFFTKHIREGFNYYRTSGVNEPTQLSEWGPQIRQATNRPTDTRKGATYNNAYQLSAEGGKIYNFMRTINFNPNFKEYLADGTPVRNGQDIILFEIGTGSDRPYLKCTSNNTDRIDFFFTDGHPVNFQNNLYHCYYKTNSDGSQGSIYQTDGTLISTLQAVIDGTPIPVNTSTIDPIFTFISEADGRPWTHSINYDTDATEEYPVVTYSKRKNRTPNDMTYHYAKWDGSKWNKFLVSDAGQGFPHPELPDYTGLITTNPYNTNEIFISSNRNPSTGVENNRYEIYSAITSDGGAIWDWIEVTQNSSQNNYRPYVPKGITTPEDRVVLWFHGDYPHYTNYTTRVVGEYINKVYDGPAPVIPEPTPPINTNITYGVDINGGSGPNLSPFKPMSAVANATVTDNGVAFTLFGSVEGSRDRGNVTPNNLVRDFVFAAGNGTTTGMRIENLPAGEYTINSFHFDNNFPAPVSVILREQGGLQIGDAIIIDNVETPASFTITAEQGKIYEVVVTGNSGNGTRFNGLSIIAPTIPVEFDTVKLDINSEDKNGSALTQIGFEALVSPRNSAPISNSTTINGVTLTIGGNVSGSRNRGGDTNLIRDFIFGAISSSETVVTIGGVPEGEYTLNSYHFDYQYPAPVSVTLREQGGATIGTVQLNANTDAEDNNQTPPIAGNSSAPASFDFTSNGLKTYELAIVGIRGSNGAGTSEFGRGPRFNGLEIGFQGVLSIKDFFKTSISSNAANLRVYPNPFVEYININSLVDFTKVEVYDISGSLVKQISIPNTKKLNNLEIEGLTTGVYFVNVYKNRQLIAIKKIIRQ